MKILKEMETKISNEIRLWFLLSCLDEDIRKSLELKLKDALDKRETEEIKGYIDYCNALLDAIEENPKEVFLYTVDTLLSSDPSFDKIGDLNRMQALDSYLNKSLKLKLEKFQAACMKASQNA